MAKKSIQKPILHQCATLGSLMGYGGRAGEWSTEKKIETIRKAGFTGFVGRTAFVSPQQVADSGLLFACTTDLGGIGEIKPKLREIKAAGARVVNVQMLDHDTPTKRAVEVARRLMATAGEMDMDVSVKCIAIPVQKRQKKPMRWRQGLKKRKRRS